MDKNAIYKAVEHAVERAFNEVGIEGFKQTSMFLSNVRRAEKATSKLAA